MIIFCEECGARNDLNSEQLSGGLLTFECGNCKQMLMVSKPSVGGGGLNAFAQMTSKPKAPSANRPVSVLIVDDSTVLRKIVREMFAADKQLEVVGEAEHGLKALELIPALKPDVITLDVNMPVMDGLTTIKHIMIKNPTPVVMFSTLTGHGKSETFDALRYGAIDFLQKPSSLLKEDLKSQHELIISRVKNAARAGIETIRYLRPAHTMDLTKAPLKSTCRRVYAISSSYGGYGSLLGLIPELPVDLEAAFIATVYAIPAHVAAFANYLDGHSALRVFHAVDGQPVEAGCCYLASAFEAVTLDNALGRPAFKVTPRVAAGLDHAADELMGSIADVAGARSGGIVLSGMGEDGIKGIGRILDGGGHVVVQEPKTCLCSETAAQVASTYGLPTVLPGMRMAETIRAEGLADGQ